MVLFIGSGFSRRCVSEWDDDSGDDNHMHYPAKQSRYVNVALNKL